MAKAKKQKDEPYKMPKCCQDALAMKRVFCPICKQTFMKGV